MTKFLPFIGSWGLLLFVHGGIGFLCKVVVLHAHVLELEVRLAHFCFARHIDHWRSDHLKSMPIVAATRCLLAWYH